MTSAAQKRKAPAGAAAAVSKKAKVAGKGGKEAPKQAAPKDKQKGQTESESEESLDEEFEDGEAEGEELPKGFSANLRVRHGDDSDSDTDDEGQDDDIVMDDEFGDDDLEGELELGGDEEGEAGEVQDAEEDDKKGSGFADAMSKILGKTVSKGAAPILAKDKTIERKLDEERLEKKARKALTLEKKQAKNKERTPLESYNLANEKALKKIATRGVVRLFNTLKKQQAGEQVVKSKPKVAKSVSNSVSQVSKSTFLDMIKSSSSQKSQSAAEKQEGSASWDVFRDDFMIGAKMKDWDKEEEEEEEYELEQEVEGEFA